MEVVRIQTEADLNICLQIRRDVFVGEQGVPIEEEIDEEDVVGIGHHLYLVDDAGTPVATARFKRYDDHTAKIQRVAVLSNYRRFGYGRLVMQAIETFAAESDFTRAVLDAQCHAEAFYKSLGYQIISSEPFYDAGILHVKMQKHLTEAPAVE